MRATATTDKMPNSVITTTSSTTVKPRELLFVGRHRTLLAFGFILRILSLRKPLAAPTDTN